METDAHDADAESAPRHEPAWREFARAPLVPLAMASGCGLVVDRYAGVPQAFGFALAALGLVGWLLAYRRQHTSLALWLWVCAMGLSAAHHHTQRFAYPDDDIGLFASDGQAIAHVRGIVDESPVVRKNSPTELFGPARKVERAVTVLDVTERRGEGGIWLPASGYLRLSIDRIVDQSDPHFLEGITVGDEIEVVGMLSKPSTPSNPGEWDHAASLLDRRIRAELRVVKSTTPATRLDSGGRWSIRFGLAWLRGRFTRVLDARFPAHEAGLARALLLGDGTAMEREEWDGFVRTGVVHVLAISGQHLVILAGFIWWTLRILGVRRRHGAWAVLFIVVGYAVVTGLRPSAMRATAMVGIACGGVLLRRPVLTANAFAFAWLVTVAWNPTDAFTAGCQLSFISVFVLIWGVSRWLAPAQKAPLDRLIDESRPPWVRAARAFLRSLAVAFALSIILTVANSPLIMQRQNLVAPMGAILGPPLVFLTTIALVAGFLLLIVGIFGIGLTFPFAVVTRESLAACDWLVRIADTVPGGSVYVPTLPIGWTIGFYAILIGVVLLDAKWAKRAGVALLLWSLFGLIGVPPTVKDELQITFLSVGHGGCTVLETPDGRVLVYDAGSMGGPDAVRRVVAPFLWHRGHARIDELFLSHADLDHFNGVVELLRRFPIGQVTLTPSFASKPTAEVAEVMLALKRYRVPQRIAVAGERFVAGSVQLEVLHPPPVGPAGSENERSLVLKVTHAGHTILLTGDLEKAGAARVLELPPVPTDILMSPHHGSRAAYTSAFAAWATPKFLVASRGNRPESAVKEGWDTFTHGAIFAKSHPTGLTVESYRTGERIVISRGGR